MAAASDEPSQDDPLIGETLGEFEIVELIGRGGMGAVYKASQPSLGRFVAIKVLPADLSRDKRYLARFKREARAAAAVDHPNIVEIHGVGRIRGYHFIIMELVHGHSLSEIIRRRGPVPAEQAVEIVRQSAVALAKAHAAGILHRDIKPSNILVAEDGQVKVADFGLAKRPGLDADVTHVGKAVGTPTYLAPECIRGGRFDARTDLYALGATFYHILAGKPPFPGRTAAEVVAKVLETQPPPLREVASGVPRGIARLIHRQLSKDPDERCRTAEEFLEALAAAETAPSGSLADLIDALGEAPAYSAEQRTPSSTAPVVPPTPRSHGTVPRARKRGFPIVPVALISSAVVAAAIVVLAIVLWPREKAPPAEKPGGPTVTERGPRPAPVEPEPKPPVKAPAWEAPWRQTQGQVAALLREQRFYEALKAYEALGRRFEDATLAERIGKAAGDLEKQADAAFRKVEKEAKRLLAMNRFADARAALAPVKNRFGILALERRGDKLLGEIAAAEKKAKPPKPKPKPKPKPPSPKPKLEQARYARAMKSVDAKVAAWDFRGAGAALAKLKFKEKALAEQLAVRRDEVKRLAQLKAKIIQRVSRFKPWLRKATAVVPGSGGKRFKTTGEQIVKADDSALTLRTVTKTGETTKPRKWGELDDGAVQKLLEATLESKSADDHLAAGILSLAREDTASAEKHLARARALGATIDRYLSPVAEAAFENGRKLLAAKQYKEADAALAETERKYAETPWVAAHKGEIAAARSKAKMAIADAEAEKLYAQGAKLYKSKTARDIPALKRVVEALQRDYAKTSVLKDPSRKPSLAEMAQAVDDAQLGPSLTVRKDGKGDHTSIQSAVYAASAKGLIEIQDEGPYNEKIVIPKEKAGLTLAGKAGCWPVIHSVKGGPAIDVLVAAKAPGVTLEGLVLAHRCPKGPIQGCVSTARYRKLLLRRVIMCMGAGVVVTGGGQDDWTVMSSFVVGRAGGSRTLKVDSSIWLGAELNPGGMVASNSVLHVRRLGGWRSSLRHCTVTGAIDFGGKNSVLVDSILGKLGPTHGQMVSVLHCDILDIDAKRLRDLGSNQQATLKNMFSKNPMFRDPKALDFRLGDKSPCKGRASDGGDVGCTYTPEMIEILKKALELRKKGMIKF